MSYEKHIKKLLINHNLRLQALQEKKALQGVDTPPEILIEIDNIKAEIKELQDELKEPSDKSTRDITNVKYRDAEPIETSSSLDDYEVEFTKSALDNIKVLGLTRGKVIELVENEFVNHLNYFLYDFQDYPLPVQNQFIVVLDKMEKKVVFRAIKRAELSELELTSWNAILGLYRRVSRYQYRTNPDHILRPETILRIKTEHQSIFGRILRHLEVFKNVKLSGDPNNFMQALTSNLDLLLNYDLTETQREKSIEAISFPKEVREIWFYISTALTSLEEISVIIADAENQLIPQKTADSEVVLCLERSLQYIHKIILSTML